MSSRVYVDLDDVLSQTIRSLLELLADHRGRHLREDEVTQFDLGASFGLPSGELEEFMDLAHRDEVLRGLRPVDGAADALGVWEERGCHISIVTGRPPTTVGATSSWLYESGIPHADLHFVDKYGRHDWDASGPRPLSLDDLSRMDFALAVEDSLETAIFIAEELGLAVALLDRPWNRDTRALSSAAGECIVRCTTWLEVLEAFPAGRTP